jgi:hypothetical protein
MENYIRYTNFSTPSITTNAFGFFMKVRLRFPLRGYSSGELTGRMVGLLHEIKLPSGELIYLFSDEYIIENSI